MGLFDKIKKAFSSKENTNVEKYEEGLTKTRDNFVNKLNLLGIKYTKISDEFYDELEEILIMADVGTKVTEKFINKIRKRVREENITDFEYLKEVIVDELLLIYVNGESLTSKIKYNENGMTTILFVGVNGVGKTTSIAKLGYRMKNEGKKVMFIGADTFRAGAVNQLKMWAEKLGVSFYGRDDTDPATVVYEGLTKANEENIDVCLIDTAGRLQNKVNLMNELGKMNRIIKRVVPEGPHETLLVVDATTGQNGVSQAIEFSKITDITGIVLTKMDGTAKGGIVLSIKDQLNIPVKFIGLGEQVDDLQEFDLEQYIYGLCKGLVEEA